MTLPSYERLGVFYLGREYDPATQQLGAELLYDSRDLTTHAVCIGMTGSGKTGLCLSLLEEAAIDGVPAIAIDPKGDIGNLLLAFPELRRRGLPPVGRRGRGGAQGQDRSTSSPRRPPRPGARASPSGARTARASQRLRDAAEVAIYTPGSEAGRPLSVLRSFAAPSAETLERRHGAQGAHRLVGGGPARPARHRGRPDQEPRAHPALGDPRRRVAQGPEPRPRRHHPGRAEAAVRQGRRVRPRELLPGEGAHRARAAHQRPARRAGLRGLAARRAARRAEAALHRRRQAAHRDHLDRAPERRRAHVRRHADRERAGGVDAPPAGHDEPARAASTWTRCSGSSRRRPCRRRSCRCSR